MTAFVSPRSRRDGRAPPPREVPARAGAADRLAAGQDEASNAAGEPATAPRRRAGPRPIASPHATALCLSLGTILFLSCLGTLVSNKTELGSGEGSPVRQVVYLAVLMIVAWAIRPVQRPGRLLALPLSLVVAVAYCWISLVWAIEPGIAVRRVLLTTILIWTMFAITTQAGFDRSIATVRITLSLVLACNYVAVLLFPAVGVHQFVEIGDQNLIGDWRGMMAQKNVAGLTCAVTIFLFVFDARRIHPLLRGLVIAAAAIFLLKSGSKTSGGLLFASIVAGWAYGRYNPAYRALLVPTALVLGVGLVFVGLSYGDQVAASLDDPDALTGRAQIWPVLIAYARDHWVLGSGYGSFWNIGVGASPASGYGKGWVTQVGNGHNGYLDLLVQIGLPGMVLVVFAAIILPLGKLLASLTIPRSRGALLTCMLVFCAAHNGTESSLFDRDMLIQLFLMLTVGLIPVAPTIEAEDGDKEASPPPKNRPTRPVPDRGNGRRAGAKLSSGLVRSERVGKISQGGRSSRTSSRGT